MSNPRGKSFREAVDEIGQKHEPNRRDLPLEEGDDLDELATDESEDPARWEAFWSNWG